MFGSEQWISLVLLGPWRVVSLTFGSYDTMNEVRDLFVYERAAGGGGGVGVVDTHL